MPDEDLIDPWLAHLRAQGASDRALTRHASCLGRIAARGLRTRADAAAVAAFRQWILARGERRA